MKHFKYLPIILGLPFVTLLASCTLNPNGPSTHVDNNTGTNDSIIQLTLKQASLVFDNETEKLTVHFSVNENIDDSIELRASFRLEDQEGNYLHLDEVKNELILNDENSSEKRYFTTSLNERFVKVSKMIINDIEYENADI